MFNLRRIKTEQDLEKARACVPENCQAPSWNTAIVVEKDGEIIGVLGAEVRHIAQAYFSKKDVIGYLMAAAQLDGIFRAVGAQQYEFFIRNEFADHQNFAEAHLPVSWEEEEGGKRYFRRLE